MSLNETPMTIWYWEQVGGTLIEEFQVVPAAKGQGRRAVDALIIVGGPRERMKPGSQVSIQGKDVLVIQTKNARLGMSLMGQTLFSSELVKRLNPRSIQSIALCKGTDLVLQPLLEAHEGCKVVICPASLVVQKTSETQ